MTIGDNGLICLSNEQAECKISLWGANVVSYRPKNEKHDVFWLGERNKFDNVQAIRGGVPVCWPRFAEEKLNCALPRHGFARLSSWTLKEVAVDNSQMEVRMSLVPDVKYNVNATVDCFVKITDKLECCLETTNHGTDVFKFSEALHAYFNVGSVSEVTIKGLAGRQYQNSLSGEVNTLEQDLKIDGEFDAAFLGHTGKAEIVDPVLKRVITVTKTGSASTVVWNPNKDLAEMSEGQYKKFVCVEPANQGETFVCLKPKEKHRLSMVVDVRRLNADENG